MIAAVELPTLGADDSDLHVDGLFPPVVVVPPGGETSVDTVVDPSAKVTNHHAGAVGSKVLYS